MAKKQIPFRLLEDIKKEFYIKLMHDDITAQDFLEKIVYAYLNLDNSDFINDPNAIKAAIKSITDNA